MKILIIRPSAIGDIVMASPMIKVLRDAYPQAHIAWLAEPHVADLVCHQEGLDEVILWPKGRWRTLLREKSFLKLTEEVRTFAADLRRRDFDLALDAVGLLKSRLLARLSGARERIGFESGEPGRFLMSRIVSRGGHIERMSSEYYHLMQVLGLDPGEFHPFLTIPRDVARAVPKILNAAGIASPYAVFAPFTTRPQKHWFEELWAELAMEIERRFGLPVLLLGGPGDAEAGRRLLGLAPSLHDLVGKTSLAQTAALVSQSALVIGVDTGLTHMGTAFRRPTVALFGATCPYLETPSPRTRVLYHPHPCSPCKRSPTCDGAFPCMRAITVEEVAVTAAALLQEREGEG